MTTGAAAATRGSAIKLTADVVARGVALGTWLLIAAALGVERLGVFAALSGLAALLAETAGFGLAGTAAWALPRGALGLATLLRARLALSAPLLLSAGAIGALALAHSPGAAQPHTGPERLLVVSLLVAYFASAGWCELLGVGLRSLGRARAEAGIVVGLRVSILGGVWLATTQGATPRGVALAQLLGSLPPLVAAAWLSASTAGGTGPPGTRLADTLRSARPVAIATLLTLAALRLELLLLLALGTPRAAGEFAVALRLLEALLAVPHAVASGAMPALARESRQRGAVSAVRARTATSLALLAVPVAVGTALLAPQLLGVLGADYPGGAPVLRLLAPAIVASFCATLLLYALAAAGRADLTPRLVGFRLVLAAVLAAVLVPLAGAMGAALGFLVAELALAIRAARACAGAGYPVPLAKPLALAALASLPMALTLPLARLPLPAAVLLGAALYAAALGLGRLLLSLRTRVR